MSVLGPSNEHVIIRASWGICGARVWRWDHHFIMRPQLSQLWAFISKAGNEAYELQMPSSVSSSRPKSALKQFSL